MDTKEHIEIQEAIQQGLPATDEGPYYHEPWWESYKGSIKGYLGGAVAYTGVGAAIGLATAGLLFFTGLAAAATVMPIVAGCAAAGLLYGAHEFNEIGKIVGSGAAIAEKQEERSDKKFKALERKIDELKTMVSGKSSADSLFAEENTPSASDIRHHTTHMGEHAEGKGKLIFWNIAAVGLAVGLAAGAMLAFGGTAEHLLQFMGKAGEPLLKAGGAVINTAIITGMGLFGASFGINRDIFRRVFDQTDLWFKGLVTHPGRQQGQSIEQSREKTETAPIVTVVYPDLPDYPSSDTHHRDKLAAAKLALLNLDPNKTMRQ